MMNLAEYRRTANRLADYLPWVALVAEGVVLNKDGSFQRTASFRGPDLDSAVAAELVAVASRINNAFRRLGSGWSIFVEAQRSEAATYPGSTFPDPASGLVEAERILAIQLFVTLIEFKLSTLAGFVLIPFGLFGKTAFMAERVLGNVISSGIKVLVLAVIIGIGSTLFSEFTRGFGGATPSIDDAMAVVLAALSLVGLGIFGPGIANGLVSGGPQLGAGAAVGTGLAAGGMVLAGAGAAGLAAKGGAAAFSTGAAAVRGGATAAGAASAAYSLGSLGQSGASGVASGMGGVGRAAGSAAISPLRRAAASVKSSFSDGVKSGFGATGGSSTTGTVGGAAEAPSAPSQPANAAPGWAQRMRQSGHTGHAVQTTVKHMLRLRRDGGIGKPEAAEVIIVNSHDGTSAYQMFAGMLRFVCTNSMIAGERFEEIRVPHKGNIQHDIIEGVYTVAEDFPRLIDASETMKEIRISEDERRVLAEASLVARYGADESPLRPEQIIEPRRREDMGGSLWSTFNVIQEHLTKGGLHGQKRNAEGRIRRNQTRAVNGIDQNIGLNRALWTLAEGMQKLKGY